jgi:hypothetical protein
MPFCDNNWARHSLTSRNKNASLSLQRKLASTPVITQGNGGLRVIPSKVYRIFFYGLDGEANRNAGIAPNQNRQTMNSCAAISRLKYIAII